MDHITPRGAWPPHTPGVDDPANLRTLCTPCHEGVSALQAYHRARAARTAKKYRQQVGRRIGSRRIDSSNTQGNVVRSNNNESKNVNENPNKSIEDSSTETKRRSQEISDRKTYGANFSQTPPLPKPCAADSLPKVPQTEGFAAQSAPNNKNNGTPETMHSPDIKNALIPSFGTEPAKGGWTEPGDIWGLPYDSTEGVWPRFMTPQHPKAVGTFGWEFIAWAEHPDQRLLNPKRSEGLRWWQKAVALRVLEYDEDEHLCWEKVLITVARQSGKSWFMRCLIAWRLGKAEAFGETQTILHVAHKLQGAYEVWRPATRWAIHHWGSKSVRFANGEEQITTPDGDRWMVQAANDGAGVSMSLGMVFVDEAWRVKREVIDGAIGPTMAESEQPQMYLVSTAGDAESDLMLMARDAALTELEAPQTTLILEWSARPEDDVKDERAWRAASPHWSPRRRQVVLAALGSSTEAEFRSQWMNQWQPSIDESQALVSAAVWDSCARVTLPRFGDESSIVVEVEHNFGNGACVALAWCDPDTSQIAGQVELVERLPDAWLRVQEYRERWPNCVVQVGVTLATDPLLVDVVGYDGAGKVGTTELREALPLLRELIGQHRLVHNGQPDLRQQIIQCRVRAAVGGGLGVVGIDERRSDAVRAFTRAVLSAHRSVGVAPQIW